MFQQTKNHDLTLLQSPDADVYLQGAQLARFRDWLFLSPDARFVAGKSLRGGVPICFPWFGPKKDDPSAPQHGFVRTAIWEIENVADDALTLQLANENWRARMKFEFGEELRLRFETDNLSDEPFPFECALHTYFAVEDVRQISIGGLDGVTYLDKPDAYARKIQSGDITFNGETDRVYLSASGPIAIRDARRTIEIKGHTGWRSTIVWNPGREVAAGMKDVGAQVWPRFVCVECGAVADDAVTLAPGETYALDVSIAVNYLE